jgi:hypothetical protein
MNDALRERGWPLNSQELDEYTRQTYSLHTLTTRGSLVGKMKVGSVISGLLSGAVATVVDRRLDFGQLLVQVSSGTFLAGEIITTTIEDVVETITIESSVDQFNSIHHWEDSDGIVVDIDPAIGTSGFFTPITLTEDVARQNDLLKTIKVIKPQSAGAVLKAFREALAK